MQNPAELQAIRLPQVEARTGLKRTQIYKFEAEGNFPERIKLGERATAWYSHEVDAWLLSRQRKSMAENDTMRALRARPRKTKKKIKKASQATRSKPRESTQGAPA